MPKQAKTLTLVEQQKVLTYINTKKHSTRNRALVMTSFLSGMRVGEIASLRYKDVMDEEGKVRSEIRLTAEQTKGNEARIVFVNDKLRIELQKYAKLYKVADAPHKVARVIDVEHPLRNIDVAAPCGAQSKKGGRKMQPD